MPSRLRRVPPLLRSRPLSPALPSPLLRLTLGLLLLLLGPAVTHGSAVVDLGDITALATSQAESGRLAETEAVQTYRFTLTATKAVTLELRLVHADADLYLEAADGRLLHGSEQPGPVAEWIAAVLPAGAYAVQIEAREAGKTPYTLHYEVATPDAATPRGRSATEGPRRRRGYVGEEYMSEWMLAMQTEAVELGDITDLADQDWRRGEISYGDDDSYRFTLTESKDVSLRLTEMEGNVNLFLYDADINKLYQSQKSRLADDTISKTLRAGTYYIIVRDFAGWSAEWSYALGYTVSAASEELPPLEDDFPHDTSTEGTVPLTDGSGEATGDIEFRGDRDWFRIALEKGQTYELHLRGTATGHGRLRDPVLQLHDADGAAIPLTLDTRSGVRNNAWQFFTPPLDPDAEDCGDIECVPSDDPAPPGPRTYYIEARAYRDTVGAYGGHKGTYTVSVDEYTSPEGDDYPSFVPPEPPDVPTEEIPDSPPLLEAGSALRGEIETVGDRDWFALDLEAGVEYAITALDGIHSFGTLSYGILRGIYDANGRVVTDGVTEWSIGFLFQPSQTGRYYVSMDADDTSIWGDTQEEWDNYHANLRPYFDDYKWAIGTYTIVLRDEIIPVSSCHHDLFAVMFLAAEDIEVGSPVAGTLERGDSDDWYAVVGLEADRTYQIDLKGASTGDGTLENPRLRMYHARRGAGGMILCSDGGLNGQADDDSGEGLNSRLEVDAAAGEYYLLVSPHFDPDDPASWRDSGTYTVMVTDITPGAEPPDTTPEEDETEFTPEEDTDDAARTVAVGGVTRSTVRTAATCDRVEMHLEAGRTYRIDLAGASTEGGSLPDPYLGGLYDPDGSLIPGTTNDDGGPGRNSQVIFTPRETGTYEVAACAYGASSGGTYTLSVEEMADDFSADTGTKGTVTVGGAATGEVQAAGDLDWFAVELAAATSYVIELEGVLDCEDCTLLEPALHGLYNAGGRLIAGTTNDDGRADPPSQVTFTPPATATYYVAAGAHGDGLGTYTVRVRAGTAGS